MDCSTPAALFVPASFQQCLQFSCTTFENLIPTAKSQIITHTFNTIRNMLYIDICENVHNVHLH